MIPVFTPSGSLPPGIWGATVEEIEERFVSNPVRQALFEAFADVVELLRSAECKSMYLDGSFICDEPEPVDYDLCYEPTGMRPTEEFKFFLRLTLEERKNIYLGDIFIRLPIPPYFLDHVLFWQTDQDGEAKGIIRIE